MKNIKIKSLGPIKEANINFGDLTFFVGPQASGKSIVLQLIKLLIDKKGIESTLDNYGYVWGLNIHDNLTRFFGEGMDDVWNTNTKINFDGVQYDLDYLLPSSFSKREKLTLKWDKLYYIPAQRVVSLNYGWPRFFNDYEDSVPYVLRDFSERLRRYLEMRVRFDEEDEDGIDRKIIFPQEGKLNERLNTSFNDSIFHGGTLQIDKTAKKRLKLNQDDLSIPFMAWSSGQKEFMPLLISFYQLCVARPGGRRRGVDYVVIEEPEMGLHPEAIKSVILQIIELLSRGYQVIVSTHSPVLLEFAWAFNILKKEKAPITAFDDLFDFPKNNRINSFFSDELINKSINTYYFDRKNGSVTVQDITSLDAGSKDLAIAEWGGLSSFSAKANDIVSTIVANNG
jgi:energy-coupling factor transporter ATP-binding protein EcfA2